MGPCGVGSVGGALFAVMADISGPSTKPLATALFRGIMGAESAVNTGGMVGAV